MKKAILYLLAAVCGITGTGFALAQYLLWNDTGASIATLAGVALIAALIAPQE